MKKRVFISLDVESDDPLMMTRDFIKNDLMQEILCASNYYELDDFIVLDLDAFKDDDT